MFEINSSRIRRFSSKSLIPSSQRSVCHAVCVKWVDVPSLMNGSVEASTHVYHTTIVESNRFSTKSSYPVGNWPFYSTFKTKCPINEYFKRYITSEYLVTFEMLKDTWNKCRDIWMTKLKGILARIFIKLKVYRSTPDSSIIFSRNDNVWMYFIYIYI